MRGERQHLHLDITEQALGELLEHAGFERITLQRAARDPQPPHCMTLVATGVKPA